MSEAFDEIEQSPPISPRLRPSRSDLGTKGTMTPKLSELVVSGEGSKEYERPFYGLIVDGVHIHPHSVRVRAHSSTYEPLRVLTLHS